MAKIKYSEIITKADRQALKRIEKNAKKTIEIITQIERDINKLGNGK